MEVPNTQVSEQTENETPKTAQDYFAEFGYENPVEEVVEKIDTEPEESKVDIRTQVNEILKNIQVDDNGKFIYPEGISPELKAAVAATKSFRDTQSSYTKAQQELKALKAEAEALKQQLAQYETPTSGLSPEEQKELEELKYANPDEWYQRMRQLEAQAKDKVKEKLEEVSKKAKEETEIEYRKRRLEEFNQNRETPVTPEQLELMVPPIYAKQLLDGEIDFDTYLEKAVAFIEGPKVVDKGQEPSQTANMNTLTGSQQAIAETPDPGIDYAHITF